MSLYFQTTERCNMLCNHCGYNCTHIGYDVSEKVFKRTIEVAKKLKTSIVFGGGEPTLHPKIIDFVNYTIKNKVRSSLISNGSIKDVMLKLYEIHKKEEKEKNISLFNLCISLDKHHDLSMISNEVLKLADERKIFIHSEKNEEIFPAGIGRALLNFKETYQGCLCPFPQIKTTGDIYWCACKNTPFIGSIFEDNITEKLEIVKDCWNNNVVDNHIKQLKIDLDFEFKDFYKEIIYIENNC